MSQTIERTKAVNLNKVTTAAPIAVLPSAKLDAAPNDFLRMIEAVVTNPAVDVEKVQSLMQMHLADLARTAEQAFSAAMLKVHSEVPIVVSDKLNSHTGSKYPSLEKVQTALRPLLLANGFTCTFTEGSAPVDGMLHIIGTVRHAGGHTEIFNRYARADTSGPSGTRNKTEVQGSQSSVSYLTRRLLCSIWGVTIADDDKDGNAPNAPVIDAKQVVTLQKLMGQVKQDMKRFLTYYKITTLAELPLSSYADALQELQGKLAKMPNKAVA